jgi:hypothetical protein
MKKNNNIIMLAIVSLLGMLGCNEDKRFIEPLPEHPDTKGFKDAFGEDKFWENYMDELASFMLNLEEKYELYADFHAQYAAVLSMLRHPKEHMIMPPDKNLYPKLVRKIGHLRKPLVIFSCIKKKIWLYGVNLNRETNEFDIYFFYKKKHYRIIINRKLANRDKNFIVKYNLKYKKYSEKELSEYCKESILDSTNIIQLEYKKGLVVPLPDENVDLFVSIKDRMNLDSSAVPVHYLGLK